MNNLPIQTYESVVQQRDALEKRLAEMVAENAELKSRVVIVPAKSYVKDMRCNVVRWAKVIDALSDAGVAFVRDDGELIAGAKETPATDAFTREMMAKGVELFAEHLGSNEFAKESSMAYRFVDRLRKGINDAQ